MGQPPVDWIPAGVDTETPNAARLYGYWPGGAHDVAADEESGDRVAEMVPVQEFAHSDRAFLQRVGRYLIPEAGIWLVKNEYDRVTIPNFDPLRQCADILADLLRVGQRPYGLTSNRDY